MSKSAERLEDEALIARFLDGDASGCEGLVRKYRDRVIRIAYRIVRNEQEAADISQEAFIRVHRALGKFSGKSSFYTWLYRIVTNLAIDNRRRLKRKVEYRDEIKPDEAAEHSQLVLQTESPRQQAADSELEQIIHREIDKLPEYHRLVVVLRDIEGFSYKEVADILHCSLGTVMSRLHYARDKLQKALEEYL